MLSNAQLADLMAYPWPGNVRELRNVADRFVLGLLGERLTPTVDGCSISELAQGLPGQMEHFERSVIVEALRRHQGDQLSTAKALGIARQTLGDKLKRLSIVLEEYS